MKYSTKSLLILPTLALIFLASCGGGTQPSPTTDVNAIYTQAAATAFAQLTQTALAVPSTPTSTSTLEVTVTVQFTDTPSIAETPTLTITPIRTVFPTSESCDGSAFIDDVTIEDGSSVFPGANFKKTWRVKNTGSCAWTPYYMVIYSYSSDNWTSIKVHPPAPAEIGISVAVGQTADVSIVITAPVVSGEYYGVFRMANAKGYAFGTELSVLIEVTGTPFPTKKP